MLVFSRKYFSQKLGFLPKSLLFLGIFLNALFKVLFGWVARLVPALFDALLINGTLYAALMLKFGTNGGFYQWTEFKWAFLLHGSMTLIFLAVFAVSGLYSGKSRTFTAYAKAVLLASLLFFSFVYFIPTIRFSRIAFTATCLCLFFLLPLWRRLFSLIFQGLPSGLSRNRRAIIVGTGPMARRIFEKLFTGNGASGGFTGFIRLPTEPSAMEPGPLILGAPEDIARLVDEKRITEIILATPDKSRLDYIGLIQFCTKKGIALRMVQGMLEEDKYFILDIALSESTVI
jgi:FlaA1/EpsC-like NDP-sugar epimerase